MVANLPFQLCWYIQIMTQINVCVLGGPHLLVMHLYVSGQFLGSLLPLDAFVSGNLFSEADLSAINFFHLSVGHLVGSWCLECMTQSCILWPLPLFSFVIFEGFFYLSYVLPLLFVLRRQRMHAHKIQLLYCLFVNLVQFSFWFHGKLVDITCFLMNRI